MEHAPLRPVPARPAGPIDPATATRAVVEWLPALAPEAARALALVALSEQARAEAAESLGVSEAELGDLLAGARKELRQTVASLGGRGWCERAEGLISDRLDGVLAGKADVRRLDVHLRNCARCVEHERRLVQATDALVGALGGPSVPSGRETPVTPLAEAPQEAPPVEAPPEELPPAEDVPEELPAADVPDELPAPEAPEELRAGHTPDELPPADDASKVLPSAPVAGPDEIAAAAEVLVAVRTRRQIAGAVAWNAMIALAILLTVATIALTVAGILGAEL